MRHAALLSVLLALLCGVAQFHTVDRRGTERIRSATFVWQTPTVRPLLAHSRALVGIYTTSVAVSAVGCFALLWFAVGVRGEGTGRRSRASEARSWFTNVLEGSYSGGRASVVCGVAAAALGTYVAWRLGAFNFARIFGVEDTFASYDHPFHIARAVTLLRSVLDGHSLRWVANHQGGYPAEFYPFGFAWAEVGLWASAFGLIAMPVIHKLAVIALFLSPALLFRAMARRDGWPPTVGLAAFILHVAAPGNMWHGGYSELVYMGLVSNVAASVAVIAAMLAAADAFASESRRSVAIAGAAGAAAIWCNPRSAIGLVVCVGAAWLVALLCHERKGLAWRATRDLLVLAALAALLAAPELGSLLRYRDLYYFVRFTSYASTLEYVTASIDAVSLPGAGFAGLGLVAAGLAARRRYITKTTAVALLAYAATTLLFSFGAPSLVQQLEATRLMPVQRLLMLYLAAVGLHAGARVVATRVATRQAIAYALEGVVMAAVLFVFLGPIPLLSFWSRGLFEVQRAAVPPMAIFQQALTLAEQAAPPDTALLVVGSKVSTHQQLWAPVRSDRLFFYDYWMWQWQTRQPGPYDPRHDAKYDEDRLSEIFDRSYLDANAIGAVLITPDAQSFAERSANLERVFGGDYGLFTVRNPVPIVTFAGAAPQTISVANHRIEASGTSSGGAALIRRNWFPRWSAMVNGQKVPLEQTSGGYMRVAVPAGPVHLVLTYQLLTADKVARGAGVAGTLLLLTLLFTPAPARRRSR